MLKEFISKITKSFAEAGDISTPPRDMMKEVMSADTDLYVNVRPTHYNPDILAQRKGGLRVYEKMRRDDAITACLGLKKYAVLSSGWDVEPVSDDPKDVEIAEFIEANFKKMKGVFDDILLEIMTAFDYGFSVTEKVLKVDSWRKYQNRIMLKMLKTRKPHGIDFDADIHGNLLDDGVVQAKSDRFPAKKFVIYVNKQEFGNWYGESDLRNCYRAWWSKDNIIKFWNIFLERYGMPPAIGRIEGELQNESADMSKIQNILKTLQSASSVILPENIELEFPNINTGQASGSYKLAIEKHDMAIARALLVPNLLGLSAQGAHGSYSQAKTQFDVFLFIILKIRRGIEELLNENLVRELVDYNYTVDEYPTFKFMPLEDDTKLELAKMFLEATKIGALIPDHDDKNLLRKILGWPEKEEEEVLPGEIAPSPTTPPVGGQPKVEVPEEEIAEGKEEAKKEEEKEKKELAKEEFDYEYEAHRPLTRFEKKVNFARVDKELTELETSSMERLMDILVKQRDHIVDFLGKRLEAKTVTMKLINSLQLKYGREMQQTLREMLREAHTLGRDSSAAEVKVKRYQKLPPVHAINWFADQGFQIKGVIDGSINNSVKQLLVQGLESGETTRETIQKISRVYTPWIGTREKIADEAVIRPYRTETVVRTNMMSAYNHGRIAMSFEEEVKDYVKGWQYSAILDDRTTDICLKLDGRIFRKGDPALNRVVPPNHFNCRSMLVPVTEDEEPFESISRAETDTVLQLIPEQFGGRVGGLPVVKSVPKEPTVEERLKLSKIKQGSYKTDFTTKNDPLLETINKLRGYDGLPKIVAREEMDSLIGKGHKELLRGVTKTEYATAFKEGKFFAGRGGFGNGTYTVHGDVTTVGNIAQTYAGEDGVIMRMTFTKDAKVVSYDKISREMKLENVYQKELFELQMEAYRKADPQLLEHALVLQKLTNNVGRYAVMRGYDIIDAGGGTNEFIILNRNKVIIQKENV